MNLRVLVSGASIAGPALALYLARYGAKVVVVEKAPELRTGGQLVDLRGVAREALRRKGLYEKVMEAKEANFGLSFINHKNKRQGRLAVADFGGDGPIAEIEILRGSLSRVFYDASTDAVEYRFGDRIIDVSDDGSGVDVAFSSGVTERFDLVIGADGIHSELRDLVFAPHERRLVHQGTYLSFWTAENHIGLKDWSLAYSEPGRTIGMRAILGNAKVMAFFSFKAQGPPSYDRRDTEVQKRIVLARASGMGWEAAQLLAQIESAPDFYFDPCIQVKLDRWSRGRIAFIGDAAYCASPLSGHGATLGTVGAYVLAGELARAGGDHVRAFDAYESKLRSWVERVQNGVDGPGDLMTPQTSRAIKLRNRLSALAPYLPAREFLVRDQIAMSNSLRLDDYDGALSLLARG
ncbi:FAD-dependent monooxygenase [Saccharomonospora xinjiangensis]|uniref:FAD-dependent monooxygenase n=1 Tax=Saccharomonospora xinjiangensis TaxID=75294 RepID=UPI0010706995|nr:FAD-dependent monooxygenase [Saccharomonospora xinjiangensis]QBQ61250.1 3-hydroxybenzoate 6-hydroxylase 1 [Saccharomonospora xinjiangensis]